MVFLSFGKINFLYLIYFNQILISSFTVYLFFSLCKNFFHERFSLFGALIFSVFPLIIYSNGLISSACLQLFFYILFINLFLKLLTNEFNNKDLFFLIVTSALTLFLRGEFLIIFLFSLAFIIFLDKKKFIHSLLILSFTILLVSPYLIRNYVNTGNIHLVNVTGYALWKGNNQLAKVEGFHDSLHPDNRKSWPKNSEFENLYKKLDSINKDNQYEINQFKVNHYDLFRIKSLEEIKNLDLFDDIMNSILLIEWPQIIEKKPRDLIELNFEYGKDHQTRSVQIKGLNH